MTPTNNPSQPPRIARSPNRVTQLLPSLAHSIWPVAIPSTKTKDKRSVAGPISPAALNAPKTTMILL